MRAPFVGLSVMIADDFRAAALPLLEAGLVDALEWSFDIGWEAPAIPPWVGPLLDRYAHAGRLYGHGVTFSPLSARWEARQDAWLTRLASECNARMYRHVSEHFGFMTAGAFDRGAPLPVPFTPEACAIGRDRLARLARAADVPIGLENLALALGPRDVDEQGAFLDALLAPLDGFVVLDVHNLHCQITNFARDPEALLATYPLERVREIHVSGGSWSIAGGRPFRRDTHDGPPPETVLSLLGLALARCPNVELVVFERLGGTLGTLADAAQFRHDFSAIRAIVEESRHG